MIDKEETIRNGIVIRRIYREKGNLHRLNGPAIEEFYYPSGDLRSKGFFACGKEHAVRMPALTMYYDNGNVEQQIYKLNGKLHNKTGPAVLEFYKNGAQSLLKWASYGLSINAIDPSKPYYLSFYESGQLHAEKYSSVRKDRSGVKISFDDRDFRIGPAVINYHRNGCYSQKYFYKNSLLHNLIGPAFIMFDDRGKTIGEDYFINGSHYASKQLWATDAAIKLKELENEEKNISTVKTTVDTNHNGGCYCRKCGSFEKYTLPDGPDGKVVCWGCKAW